MIHLHCKWLLGASNGSGRHSRWNWHGLHIYEDTFNSDLPEMRDWRDIYRSHRRKQTWLVTQRKSVSDQSQLWYRKCILLKNGIGAFPEQRRRYLGNVLDANVLMQIWAQVQLLDSDLSVLQFLPFAFVFWNRIFDSTLSVRKVRSTILPVKERLIFVIRLLESGRKHAELGSLAESDESDGSLEELWACIWSQVKHFMRSACQVTHTL